VRTSLIAAARDRGEDHGWPNRRASERTDAENQCDRTYYEQNDHAERDERPTHDTLSMASSSSQMRQTLASLLVAA
jgi:hypothetical protein